MIRLIAAELLRWTAYAVGGAVGLLSGAFVGHAEPRLLDALMAPLSLLLVIGALAWAMLTIKPKGVR